MEFVEDEEGEVDEEGWALDWKVVEPKRSLAVCGWGVAGPGRCLSERKLVKDIMNRQMQTKGGDELKEIIMDARNWQKVDRAHQVRKMLEVALKPREIKGHGEQRLMHCIIAAFNRSFSTFRSL